MINAVGAYLVSFYYMLYGFASSVVIASQQTSLVLEGRHNADRGWISELKKTGEALVQ